jgi:Glycoside-hydrolase family GH114
MAGVERGWCSIVQDIRSNKTRAIMAKRFDYAKRIGCDGVDPDNTGAHDVSRHPVALHQ